MHYSTTLFLFLFSSAGFGGSQSYPDGAPDRVCSNGLVPGHGRKEHGVSPYRVSASSGRYSANKPIRVRIESLTDDAFKGFVVQAQDSYGDAILDGEWRSDEGKAIRKCGAITHRDSHDKQDIRLTWTPKHGSGSVTFVATIAKTKKLYYHNIKADVVGGSHKSTFPKQSSSHLFAPSEEDEFRSHLKVTKLRERPERLSSSPSASSSKPEWSSSPPSLFTSWSMEAHHPRGGVSSSVSKQIQPRPSSSLSSSSSSADEFFSRPISHSFLHEPFPPHQKSQSFPPSKGLHVEELEFAGASSSFDFMAPPFRRRRPGQGTRFQQHSRHLV